MSQHATYKVESHALHTETANTNEKSELQATLSAKMCNIGLGLPEAEPENLFNTAGPRRSPSWILPGELWTPRRPTTGGEQTQHFSNMPSVM